VEHLQGSHKYWLEILWIELKFPKFYKNNLDFAQFIVPSMIVMAFQHAVYSVKLDMYCIITEELLKKLYKHSQLTHISRNILAVAYGVGLLLNISKAMMILK